MGVGDATEPGVSRRSTRTSLTGTVGLGVNANLDRLDVGGPGLPGPFGDVEAEER